MVVMVWFLGFGFTGIQKGKSGLMVLMLYSNNAIMADLTVIREFKVGLHRT